MKKVLLFLATAVLANSQVTLNLSGPATVKQGASVYLGVQSGGATANGPAGLQWTLTPPSGITVTNAVVGAQATSVSKQIACNASKLLCLVYGMNQNVIPNGQVGVLTVQIPSNATPGPASFLLSGLVAGDKNGLVMTSSSGPVFTLTILSRADIDSNGTVDASDVSAMAGQVTGGTCVDDQNADGKCDITDVLLVVLRALGL